MKIFLVYFSLVLSLFAGLAVGGPFPATSLDDQFEKRHTVTADDRIVMISFGRSVSGAVNDFLKRQPKGFLATHHAKYIADISAMPTIISTLFALPKMRDYHYPVMLNFNETFAKHFDKKEGKLTIYRLESGKVVSIDFIDGGSLVKYFAP